MAEAICGSGRRAYKRRELLRKRKRIRRGSRLEESAVSRRASGLRERGEESGRVKPQVNCREVPQANPFRWRLRQNQDPGRGRGARPDRREPHRRSSRSWRHARLFVGLRRYEEAWGDSRKSRQRWRKRRPRSPIRFFQERVEFQLKLAARRVKPALQTEEQEWREFPPGRREPRLATSRFLSGCCGLSASNGRGARRR